MSFAIELSATARQAFLRLDVPVQEAVIDELERLAAGGGLLPGRPLPASTISDPRVDTPDGRYYLFIEVEYDEPGRTLVVNRIGHFLRRSDDGG